MFKLGDTVVERGFEDRPRKVIGVNTVNGDLYLSDGATVTAATAGDWSKSA